MLIPRIFFLCTHVADKVCRKTELYKAIKMRLTLAPNLYLPCDISDPRVITRFPLSGCRCPN